MAAVNAGLQDAFLAKFDADGNNLWTRQQGTTLRDTATAVAIDAQGNTLITGFMNGAGIGTAGQTDDGFLAKFGPSGNLLSDQTFGTTSSDDPAGIALDKSGGVYLVGFTYGNFAGQNAGFADAFIAKFSQVPEPSSLALLVSGCFCFVRRRPRC